MTPLQIANYLDPESFEPFRMIMEDNEEFDVYDRANIKVLNNGSMYIFRSIREEPGVKELVGIRWVREIRTVEKLTQSPV